MLIRIRFDAPRRIWTYIQSTAASPAASLLSPCSLRAAHRAHARLGCSCTSSHTCLAVPCLHLPRLDPRLQVHLPRLQVHLPRLGPCSGASTSGILDRPSCRENEETARRTSLGARTAPSWVAWQCPQSSHFTGCGVSCDLQAWPGACRGTMRSRREMGSKGSGKKLE